MLSGIGVNKKSGKHVNGWPAEVEHRAVGHIAIGKADSFESGRTQVTVLVQLG